MANLSAPNSGSAYSPKGLCVIVGLACLAGFAVDLFVLTYPPSFGALEWRVGFMQQVSDRSVILLFGLALLMYGVLDIRTWRRQLAMGCMVLGAVFLLSSVLVIRDSATLQRDTLSKITGQATQIQTQINQLQSNPQAARNLTPEQLQEALKRLTAQSENLQRNATTGILRTGIASVGNLIVIGLALLGLGRYGANPPRA
jgi:hypothetical protein